MLRGLYWGSPIYGNYNIGTCKVHGDNEKNVEITMPGLEFWDITPIMENRMEHQTENEMDKMGTWVYEAAPELHLATCTYRIALTTTNLDMEMKFRFELVSGLLKKSPAQFMLRI